MFYNNYVNLCNIKGLSPSAAAEAMGFKRSVIAVMCGVVIAGVIMGLASMGVFGGISALFAPKG